MELEYKEMNRVFTRGKALWNGRDASDVRPENAPDEIAVSSFFGMELGDSNKLVQKNA